MGGFMRASKRFYSILITLMVICGPALAAELPRYSLPLGRKLVYSTSFESKNKDGSGGMSTKGTWQLTVVRENADGSRRIIIRNVSTFTQNMGRGQSHSSPEEVNLAYADLFPDGRVTANPSLGMRIDLAVALPALPKDEAEMLKGWTQANEAKLQVTRFEPK